jgi:acyl carrier protein phosphodiesterase
MSEDESERKMAAKAANDISVEEMTELEKKLKQPEMQELMFRGRLRAIMWDHIPYKRWAVVVKNKNLQEKLLQVVQQQDIIKNEEAQIDFITLADLDWGESIHVRYLYSGTQRKFDLFIDRNTKRCQTNTTGPREFYSEKLETLLMAQCPVLE